MKLYLIRHGETDWNREPARCQGWANVALNAAGRAQARERGKALFRRGIERIVASHLLRARETAELILEELGGGLPLSFDPRLAETYRGSWETRTFAEIMAGEPDAWRAYREHPETFRFPHGESLAEQQRRVLASVLDNLHSGKTTLLVTHGGSIRLLRCFLDGRGIAAFHTSETSNGGVDEIETRGVATRIAAFLESVDAETKS
jgi:broad specificity phosphatase PhoE